MMKKNSILLLLVAALIAVIVVEEIRIKDLRNELAAQSEKASSETVKPVTAPRPQSLSSRESTRDTSLADRDEVKEKETTALEDFGKAMRKMAENPAAREMFKTGHVAAARMMYGSLLESLNLTKEEEEYFLGVLAGEFADQQQMGMRMLGARSVEDRRAIAEELENNKQKRKEQIAEFLNNDEDNAEFEKYQERLPERQQLGGIKAAIAQTGTPLTEEQETQLVDVMHRIRTSSKASKKWDGANAMEMFARPDVEEVFEKDWAAGQEALKGEVGSILNDEQSAAFFESQAQTKQMHLMGLRMMKNMMQNSDGE
ncbi:MAG: hypothetical protein ACON5H_05200 [Akkermansiaceae bacterium]